MAHDLPTKEYCKMPEFLFFNWMTDLHVYNLYMLWHFPFLKKHMAALSVAMQIKWLFAIFMPNWNVFQLSVSQVSDVKASQRLLRNIKNVYLDLPRNNAFFDTFSWGIHYLGCDKRLELFRFKYTILHIQPKKTVMGITYVSTERIFDSRIFM